MSGTHAGNYSLNSVATTTANITALGITGNFTADNKIYDGLTAAAVLTRTLNGVIAPDAVTLTGGTANFDNKNVGTGKTVTLLGATLSGPHAGNYTLNSVATTAANISKAVLTVTAENKAKTFGEVNPPFTAAYAGFVNLETLATSGVTGAPSLTTTATAASVPGAYTITAALGSLAAGNYSFQFTNGTLTISALPTTTNLTLSLNSVQYSDPLTYTATISPSRAANGASAVTGVNFLVGTQLPAGATNMGLGTCTESGVTTGVASGLLTCTLTAQRADTPQYPASANTAPGGHTAYAAFAAVTGFTVSTPAAMFTVTKEDADVTSTSPVMLFTATPTSTSVNVPLSATIRDITEYSLATDPNAGDIRNARVNIRVNGTIRSGCGNLTPSPVGANNKVGTVGCTVSLTTDADGETYDIAYEVNHHYLGSGETSTMITVALPGQQGFLTGGGFFKPLANQSQGTYAAKAGTKTNMGFNVKPNKSNKNLQGNVNIIVRGDNGKVYQFKSNAIDSLNITSSTAVGGKAYFLSKCNVTDITNPLAPISLGGGMSMRLDLEDNGEPGSSDRISISVMNGNTLLFSSMWNGTSTVLRLLEGGNFQVR